MDDYSKRSLENEKSKIEFALKIKDFKRRGFKIEDCFFSERTVKRIINVVVFVVSFAVTLFAMNVYKPLWDGKSYYIFPIFFLFIVAMPLHELIHAIGFIMRGKRWKENIRFGISIKMMIAYCHCSAPMSCMDYLIGIILPFTVLGVGLFVVSIVSGSKVLLFLSILNAAVSIGDLMILCLLFKKRPSFVLDHPTEIGFVALYEQSPETDVNSGATC